MHLAIDGVVMQLGIESRCDLSSGTREGDTVFAARNAIDRKTPLIEPRLYLRNIGVGYAKLLGELLRRKPLVIQRRR